MALGHTTSAVAGPNCKTWSSLLQRRSEGFPVQKRERADPWTSVQGSGSQSELDMESLLFLKPSFLIQRGKTLYGDKVAYLLEHPEDPEPLDKSWLRPEEREVPYPSV